MPSLLIGNPHACKLEGKREGKRLLALGALRCTRTSTRWTRPVLHGMSMRKRGHDMDAHTDGCMCARMGDMGECGHVR